MGCGCLGKGSSGGDNVDVTAQDNVIPVKPYQRRTGTKSELKKGVFVIIREKSQALLSRLQSNLSQVSRANLHREHSSASDHQPHVQPPAHPPGHTEDFGEEATYNLGKPSSYKQHQGSSLRVKDAAPKKSSLRVRVQAEPDSSSAAGSAAPHIGSSSGKARPSSRRHQSFKKSCTELPQYLEFEADGNYYTKKNAEANNEDRKKAPERVTYAGGSSNLQGPGSRTSRQQQQQQQQPGDTSIGGASSPQAALNFGSSSSRSLGAAKRPSTAFRPSLAGPGSGHLQFQAASPPGGSDQPQLQPPRQPPVIVMPPTGTAISQVPLADPWLLHQQQNITNLLGHSNRYDAAGILTEVASPTSSAWGALNSMGPPPPAPPAPPLSAAVEAGVTGHGMLPDDDTPWNQSLAEPGPLGLAAGLDAGPGGSTVSPRKFQQQLQHSRTAAAIAAAEAALTGQGQGQGVWAVGGMNGTPAPDPGTPDLGSILQHPGSQEIRVLGGSGAASAPQHTLSGLHQGYPHQHQGNAAAPGLVPPSMPLTWAQGQQQQQQQQDPAVLVLRGAWQLQQGEDVDTGAMHARAVGAAEAARRTAEKTNFEELVGRMLAEGRSSEEGAREAAVAPEAVQLQARPATAAAMGHAGAPSAGSLFAPRHQSVPPSLLGAASPSSPSTPLTQQQQPQQGQHAPQATDVGGSSLVHAAGAITQVLTAPISPQQKAAAMIEVLKASGTAQAQPAGQQQTSLHSLPGAAPSVATASSNTPQTHKAQPAASVASNSPVAPNVDQGRGGGTHPEAGGSGRGDGEALVTEVAGETLQLSRESRRKADRTHSVWRIPDRP